MLKIDEHEKHINDLSQLLKVEGIDQAKVSTILQGLRENYTEVDTTFNDNVKKITEINGLNEGLRSANMTLLSKLGTQISDLGNKDKDNKGNDNKGNEDKKDVKSLDEIAKELY